MVPNNPLFPIFGVVMIFLLGIFGFMFFSVSTEARVAEGPAVIMESVEVQEAEEVTATVRETALAPNADVAFVRATQTGPETWTFEVTVAHPDTGWEDYADGWDVVLPDGTVIKPDPDSPFTRLLLHPHETEQPFTRSQEGIIIPADVTQVIVRAHDLADGFGGREVIVNLEQDSGLDFEVIR